MPMVSGPDEMNVNKIPFAGSMDVLKLFPFLNDPNFKEYREQISGHPSFGLAQQQLRNLLSPATENDALKYDPHAYGTAMKEITRNPSFIQTFRKLPPLPEDFRTMIMDLLALKKKLADENPAADNNCSIDKKFLLEVYNKVVIMKRRRESEAAKSEYEAAKSDEALVTMKKRKGDLPVLHIKTAAMGDVEGLNEALQGGADMDGKSFRGRTALMAACVYGKVESAEFLIKSGVDVNLSDARGDTALHHAVLHGNLQCVELLLKHGASLTLKNKEGLDPIQWATIRQPEHRDEMLEMLNKHLAAAQPSLI